MSEIILTTKEVGHMDVCAICKRGYPQVRLKLRSSWLAAGGRGQIPAAARVCVHCDRAEQDRLGRGEVQLSDLWPVPHE